MKKYYVAILAIAAVLFAACSEKESFEGGDGSGSGEPILTTFTIANPRTYADGGSEIGSDDENAIYQMEFFIFDAASEVIDPTENGNNYGYRTHTTTSGTLKDSQVQIMVKDGNKKILLAINQNLGAPAASAKYKDIEELLAKHELKQTNSQTKPEIGNGTLGFAMSGKSDAIIIAGNTNNAVTIHISRLVSKVEPVDGTDVTVNIPDAELGKIFQTPLAGDAKLEFKMEGYVVINGISKSHAFTYYNNNDDETAAWDKWTLISSGGSYYRSLFTTPAPGDLKSSYSDSNATPPLNPWLVATTKKDPVVYVYENNPKPAVDSQTGISGFDRETVYAFLIKGKILDTKNNNESSTRYWRVNMIKDDNYKIFRNSIYRVILDEVNTIGYGTAQEAEEDEENGGGIIPDKDQTGIKATINIVPWRVKTQITNF